MAEIAAAEGRFVLSFSEEEFSQLGLSPEKEYKVVKADPGVWVILDKGMKKEKETDELESKVIAILKKKGLKERVEGKFEKYLNDKELKKFNELLKEGKIVKFRLSQKYKKAVYKLREETQEKGDKIAESPSGEYSLRRDGFIVVSDEETARRLSNELGPRIKKNEIKGIRGFDGNFYIIETSLYEKKAKDALNFLQQKKSAYLSELRNGLNMPPPLLKGIMEFLKEDGSVIEKRKELYKIVE